MHTISIPCFIWILNKKKYFSFEIKRGWLNYLYFALSYIQASRNRGISSMLIVEGEFDAPMSVERSPHLNSECRFLIIGDGCLWNLIDLFVQQFLFIMGIIQFTKVAYTRFIKYPSPPNCNMWDPQLCTLLASSQSWLMSSGTWRFRGINTAQ